MIPEDFIRSWRKTLENHLHLAIQEHFPKKIIVLVHVPPLKESCMYEGEISNDDYLPFFASKITGNVLLGAAKANPKIEFLVLCIPIAAPRTNLLII